MALSAADRQRIVSAARREIYDDLLTLRLAGPPYAIGLQHGSLCRAEIHSLRRAAYHYLSGEVARILRLPLRAARLITRPLLQWQARAYLPVRRVREREEMRGLADDGREREHRGARRECLAMVEREIERDGSADERQAAEITRDRVAPAARREAREPHGGGNEREPKKAFDAHAAGCRPPPSGIRRDGTRARR